MYMSQEVQGLQMIKSQEVALYHILEFKRHFIVLNTVRYYNKQQPPW